MNAAGPRGRRECGRVVTCECGSARRTGSGWMFPFAPGEREGAETHGQQQQNGRLRDQHDIIPIDLDSIAIGSTKQSNTDDLCIVAGYGSVSQCLLDPVAWCRS